eukprot:Transcript_2361.p1 GENE.Transcript_2361~~Transcript_2361.p1  ORF type:complete len:519 (-),score=243.95 Transcript_2361:127-1683(-)
MSADLKKRGLFFASLILFTDALAGSLGISVLPYFVQTLGGEDSQFGLLISTFATANILASLWIGTASDKFGRMPLLIASLVGMSIGFVATGLTTSIGLLFVARFTIGFFAGVGATARAYVAEICDSSEEKAKNMAQLGGLMMLGYAAGPPVGSALQGVVGALGFGNGLRTPFLAGGTLTICMSVVVALRMPRVRDIKAAAAADAAAAASTTDADATPSVEPPSEPLTPSQVIALGLLLLNNILAQVGMAMFIVVMPLFIKDMFGWGAAQFGILMSVFILGMAIGQIALFPKLAKAFGMMRVGVAASLVTAATYFAVSFVRGPQQLPIWLVATAVQILGGALAGPIVNVKIAELAPKDKLGMTMGFASTAEQVGRVFAPTMAAYAYEHLGPRTTFRCAVLPVLGSAACFAVVAYVQAAQRDSKARLQSAIHKVAMQAKVVSAFKVVGAEDGRAAMLKRKTLSDLNVEASAGAIEGGLMGVSPDRSTRRRSVEAAVEVRKLSMEIESEDNQGGGGKADLL